MRQYSAEYLKEGVIPHILQVNWGVLIDVDGGAVMQRLPLSQVVVGFQSSSLPEVFFRVSGISTIPILSVESLPYWVTKYYTEKNHMWGSIHTQCCVFFKSFRICKGLIILVNTLPHCKVSLPPHSHSLLLPAQLWK